MDPSGRKEGRRDRSERPPGSETEYPLVMNGAKRVGTVAAFAAMTGIVVQYSATWDLSFPGSATLGEWWWTFAVFALGCFVVYGLVRDPTDPELEGEH